MRSFVLQVFVSEKNVFLHLGGEFDRGGFISFNWEGKKLDLVFKP